MGAVLSPETGVGSMLQSKENWDAMKEFVSHVMSTREDEERTRQKQILVTM